MKRVVLDRPEILNRSCTFLTHQSTSGFLSSIQEKLLDMTGQGIQNTQAYLISLRMLTLFFLIDRNFFKFPVLAMPGPEGFDRAHTASAIGTLRGCGMRYSRF